MQTHTFRRIASFALLAGSTAAACSSSEDNGTGTGGTTSATGGKTSTGGIVSTGGVISTGGIVSTGGVISTGGIVSTGGVISSGGVINTGGSGGATTGGGGTTAKGGSGGAMAGAAGNAGGGGIGGAGGASTGGSGGSGGGAGPIPLKNPPVKSAGCDKATQVTSGEKMIMSDGKQRSYTIDVPANYDMATPHKFVYASHWIDSNDETVVREGYYHLKPEFQAANDKVIYVAPQALPGNPSGTWSTNDDLDNVLFDDILAFVKSNLCIDTTRVFAVGHSYGAMQTYSLATDHQKDIRAAVGIAPANWNIYEPPPTGQPIAWMSTTGMGDTLTAWDRNGGGATDGAKFIALEFAKNNGCDMVADVPTRTTGEYFCYDFPGCEPMFPVKACTFDGGHETTNANPWMADEIYKFLSQF